VVEVAPRPSSGNLPQVASIGNDAGGGGWPRAKGRYVISRKDE
jgi:hypothetical protein